jgi:outer membrane biosynthesis protein TonB
MRTSLAVVVLVLFALALNCGPFPNDNGRGAAAFAQAVADPPEAPRQVHIEPPPRETVTHYDERIEPPEMPVEPLEPQTRKSVAPHEERIYPPEAVEPPPEPIEPPAEIDTPKRSAAPKSKPAQEADDGFQRRNLTSLSKSPEAVDKPQVPEPQPPGAQTTTSPSDDPCAGLTAEQRKTIPMCNARLHN